MNPTEPKALLRRASGEDGERGWKARVMCGKVLEFSRFFADTTYGGKDAARERALRWRDHAMELLEHMTLTDEGC